MKGTTGLVGFLVLILVFSADNRAGEECTGFGSSGNASADGGTIVAKVRDGPVGHGKRQCVQLVFTAAGFKYIGNYNYDNYESTVPSGPFGGINEKGMSISGLSRSSTDVSTTGLLEKEIMARVLESSSDAKSAVYLVKDIVEGQGRRGVIGGGGLMVGDPNELWMVEMTGHKWAAIGPIMNEVGSMTNFYLMPELKPYEIRPSGESRQKRIQALI